MIHLTGLLLSEEVSNPAGLIIVVDNLSNQKKSFGNHSITHIYYCWISFCLFYLLNNFFLLHLIFSLLTFSLLAKLLAFTLTSSLLESIFYVYRVALWQYILLSRSLIPIKSCPKVVNKLPSLRRRPQWSTFGFLGFRKVIVTYTRKA